MFQYDEEEILLCVNCDAEYTVTKLDDEEQAPEFCPFCGYQHLGDEFDDDDEEDEEDVDLD